MKFVTLLFALSFALVALSVTSADAQMGRGRHRGGDAKVAPKTTKVDDKAYKAALGRIPNSKEKYDPWGSLGVKDSGIAPQGKKPK